LRLVSLRDFRFVFKIDWNSFLRPSTFDIRYSAVRCFINPEPLNLEPMNGHHLILGELDDYITGEPLKDTHDERYRQRLARLLVNSKGYLKGDIEPRKRLIVQAGKDRAAIKIDFLINLSGKGCMVIKYGPGSIVTRRRSLLSISRIMEPYQIPIAVVTNGEDAEIVEGLSGNVISQGLENIPTKSQLIEIAAGNNFKLITADRAEMESRIAYCYEVDGSCPCDADVCKL